MKRKTIVVLDYNTYSLNISMKKLLALFDNELLLVHRACAINKNRVLKYDIQKNVIVFDNNMEIDIVSKKRMKNSENIM